MGSILKFSAISAKSVLNCEGAGSRAAVFSLDAARGGSSNCSSLNTVQPEIDVNKRRLAARDIVMIAADMLSLLDEDSRKVAWLLEDCAAMLKENSTSADDFNAAISIE